MNSFRLNLLRVARPVMRCELSTLSKNTYPPLEVMVRNISQAGSRKSRALRKQKLIPGVLYGNDADNNVLKTMITIPQNDLNRELRLHGKSFENTVYELTVKRVVEVPTTEGAPAAGAEPAPVVTEVVSKFLVTPRQTQFEPVTDQPVAVNFLRYAPGMRLRIPLEFINEDESPDMRRGCFLVRVNHFVECVCDDVVPAKIIVDLSEVKKGDVVRLSSVQLPPKVRPAKNVALDYVLAVIQTSRG